MKDFPPSGTVIPSAVSSLSREESADTTPDYQSASRPSPRKM
jgi:hypothetical protein